jgi:hypothetical protein
MRYGVLVLILEAACARGIANGSADADGSGGHDAPGGDTTTVHDAAIDANNCATQPCDIPTQCGCASDQACDLDPMMQTATKCRAVTMQGKETNVCPADTDCAKGYVCVGSGTNDACEKYCTSDLNCTSPRGQCVIQLVDSSSNPIPGAVVCSSDCDPASLNNSATCPSGWSCDLFSATFMGTAHDISDCRKAGTKTQGAVCAATVACAAGYTCVNPGTGTTVCARICKPPSSAGCPGGTACTPFVTAFVISGVQYGVCL